MIPHTVRLGMKIASSASNGLVEEITRKAFTSPLDECNRTIVGPALLADGD